VKRSSVVGISFLLPSRMGMTKRIGDQLDGLGTASFWEPEPPAWKTLAHADPRGGPSI
jgi:hypothetical protein